MMIFVALLSWYSRGSREIVLDPGGKRKVAIMTLMLAAMSACGCEDIGYSKGWGGIHFTRLSHKGMHVLKIL